MHDGLNSDVRPSERGKPVSRSLVQSDGAEQKKFTTFCQPVGGAGWPGSDQEMYNPKTSMRGKVILALGCCLCFTIAPGCGDDEGEGAPPSIANLFFGPTSSNVGERGGEVGVSVSFEYADPDGDLAFVRLSSRPCGEGPVEHMDIAPGGIKGNKKGVVWLSTRITTACPAGTYVYEVSLFDRKGHQSNSLDATFTLGR
jgi:hypothetical protein